MVWERGELGADLTKSRGLLSPAQKICTLISYISLISLEILPENRNMPFEKGKDKMANLTAKPENIGLMERPPTAEEIDSSAHAATAIAIAMDLDGGLKISGENGDPVKIAPAVGQLIIELLGHVSNGNMVTLVPVGTMLTTQQAADMLNVSRPHLTKLLKEGKIRFEEVGKHRRVSLAALMGYRAEKTRRQDAALDALARLGQEFDQG